MPIVFNVLDNVTLLSASTGDVGFEIADNVLIKYKGKSKDAVIPEGVTKIAAKAFYAKKNLEMVFLYILSLCLQMRLLLLP